MTADTIALYATDTMADWEYAYLTAELTRAAVLRPGHRRLLIVGDGTAPVTSLGGFTIAPKADLADLDPETTAILVVPGADTYFEGHTRLLETVPRLLEAEVPVAAICGATFALARAGLLDTRRHTSNARVFLEHSGYAGAGHYTEEPVVTDQGITTASGTRPVDFTAEVMRISGLYPDSYADDWLGVYRDNDEQAFYRMMAAQEKLQSA